MSWRILLIEQIRILQEVTEMRNDMETGNANERIEVETHQGPFSWVEMLIMTVFVIVSFLLG